MTKATRDIKKRKPAKSYRFFSRPADRSLMAYKEWIRGFYIGLIWQNRLLVESLTPVHLSLKLWTDGLKKTVQPVQLSQ